MGKWSKLPSDLLLSISDRLGVPDLLRFGAVCRSWQSVIFERRRLRSPHLQIPWIWFDDVTGIHRPVEFDRITGDCRLYSLNQPQPDQPTGEEFDRWFSWFRAEHETKCIGSGYGWLVLTYHMTGKIWLLNPITGQQIHLPHLSTYFDRLRNIAYHESDDDESDEDEVGPIYSGGDFEVSKFICKAILTSSPDDEGGGGGGGGDCFVILQPSTMSRLAYARPGNKTWTLTSVIYDGCMPNTDVICHDGRIYTAMLYGGITSWGLIGRNSQLLLKPTVIIEPPNPPSMLDAPWMVSSPWGDLLYVILRPKRIRLMEVYKVDFEKQDLVEVVSIGHEHAIFKVTNTSVCLPVINIPHLQGDCIYFKHDYVDELHLRPKDREIAIYGLEGGTMHFSNLFNGESKIIIDLSSSPSSRMLRMMIERSSSRMTWFLPSLY